MEDATSHKRRGLLKHQLRLVKRKEDEKRYEIVAVPDVLSFDKGFFLVIRACQLLTRQMEGLTIVVGVAGPSGAGKTVFTNKLATFMPGIATISMDNYNDATRVIDGNFDDPRIVDYDTLLADINSLRAGNAANIPIYDFKLSRRVGYRRLEHPSSRIVIVEGIFALCEKLRPVLDLRVSITGGVHLDLVKRVLRDINRSEQAPEDIIHQISETVYPMYKAFIEPDLNTAQIKIVNKFNPFSGLQSPTYILKSARVVPEEKIRQVFPSTFSETIEDMYDIYLLPPGEDPETCQSYLRMRNRDGRYSLIFEELVTDNDFIISPRITFDVSVRLLGGLMALGYEMATILKRTSHSFFDDKLVVKIDKLEQVQRTYVQVQSKDRQLAADVARKLGLEGSYIPRSYIEQIQLERLTAEVVALPEDLKNKLSLESTTVPGSPVASGSPVVSSRYSRSASSLSWSNRPTSSSTSEQRQQERRPARLLINNIRKIYDDERGAASPYGDQVSRVQGYYDGIVEQLACVNEKLDELVARIGEVEKKVTNLYVPDPPSLFHRHEQQPLLTDEVRSLAQGQVHMNSQLDILSNFVRQTPLEQQPPTFSTTALVSVIGLALVASSLILARRK